MFLENACQSRDNFLDRSYLCFKNPFLHFLLNYSTEKMNCSCLFKREEQKNWLKCWQVIQITKDSFDNFIMKKMDDLRINALQRLPETSSCKSNTLHTCDKDMREPFLTAKTSSRNSDTTKWCSLTWEYGKSFINASGYRDKQSISEVDLIAVFQILKNCCEFQNDFTCSLFNKQSEFLQVNILKIIKCQSYLHGWIKHCYYMYITFSSLKQKLLTVKY